MQKTALLGLDFITGGISRLVLVCATKIAHNDSGRAKTLISFKEINL